MERKSAWIFWCFLAFAIIVGLFMSRGSAQEVRTTAVAVRVHHTPMPYRNPAFRAQCRREARVDAERATTIESRDEARTRARALVRSGGISEHLLFSRMSYGEEGTPWPGRNDDGYEAMLSVLDFRRHFRITRGVVTEREHVISRGEMFAAYSPRRIFPHPSPSSTNNRNLWIAELQLNGHRPPSWPRNKHARHSIHPTWRDYGCPRWLATIADVRELFDVSEENVGSGPCEEPPHHWGGRRGVDDRRPSEGGWRQIDCGVTEDRFYVTPTRSDAS